MSDGETQLEYSWELQSSDEEGVRVLETLIADQNFQEVADLSPGSEAYTSTGLLNGREYEAYAEAYTTDTAAQTETDTATTTLPDVEALTLDNGIVDEIAVSWGDVLNHGIYRVEYRQTNSEDDEIEPGEWIEHTTIDWDGTLFSVIDGLLDGEEYEVRVRTETADVTGAWVHETVITTFPAVTDFAASPTSPTSVELTWTDNADNELFYDVRRRRLVDEQEWPWQSVEQLDAGSESYTDETVQPGRTYEYAIRGVTSYTFADSDLQSVSTETADITRTVRVPPEGIKAEIDTPTGETLRPSRRLLADADYQPAINGKPAIELSIPYSQRTYGRYQALLEDEFDIDCRVWMHGVRLPVETLESVSPNRGRGSIRLRITGGRQLETYATAQFDQAQTHLAIDELIDSYTEYAREIDEPALGITPQTVQRALESVDFEQITDRSPTDPWYITDGEIRVHDTGFILDVVEDMGAISSENIVNPNFANLNQAIELFNTTQSMDGSIEPAYTIPEGEFDVYVRFRPVSLHENEEDYTMPAWEITVDDEVVESFGACSTWPTDEWRYGFAGTYFGGDVDGEIDIGINVTDDCFETASGSRARVEVDVVSVVDGRWEHDFEDNGFFSTGGTQYLWHPQSKPDRVRVRFDTEALTNQIIDATLSVDGDTSPDETVSGDEDAYNELRISEDDGVTWVTAEQTNEFSHEYETDSNTVTATVALGRYGDGRADYPSIGFNAHTIEAYQLEVTVDDTPVIFDTLVDDRLIEELPGLADQGLYVWELRRDPDADPADIHGLRFEMTRVGQRERSSKAPVVDVSGRKTIEESFDRVIIEGSARGIIEESFTASSFEPVALDFSNIQRGSERVRTTDGSTTFDRGDDYRIDWADGTIELLEAGSMSTGTEYLIDYNTKWRGQHPPDEELDDAEGARTLKQQVPAITSDLEAQQFALSVFSDVSTPLVEARIELSTEQPDASLIAALDHAEIPFDAEDGLVIYDADHDTSTASIVLEVGSRQTASEVVSRLENQFNAVAEQV